MAGTARFAIYYAPRNDDPLAQAGSAWLGRDAESGATSMGPDIQAITALTDEPRRYGFHATLKPPMRLTPGRNWADLAAAVRRLAASAAPFMLPSLHVADLHGFLALREIDHCPPLQALCDRCVADLDDLRAPPGEAELARRRKAGLTAAQDALLSRWGYPYVFEEWFFHMTLTRRLDAAEKAIVKPVADAFFGPSLHLRRHVTDICLFTQSGPDAAFVIAERVALRG
jgi:putative phosphonate metabolism protein